MISEKSVYVDNGENQNILVRIDHNLYQQCDFYRNIDQLFDCKKFPKILLDGTYNLKIDFNEKNADM